MSRIDRNQQYDDKIVLWGLRVLSNQLFDSHSTIHNNQDDILEIFANKFSYLQRYNHRYTTKEFCFKYALSLLQNKRLELTPKGQLRITEEPLYITSRQELVLQMIEIKKFSEDDLTRFNWATFPNGVINNYWLNLNLLQYLNAECDICGSKHKYGDINYFNRFYVTHDKQFRCYCPNCLQKIVCEFNSGITISDEDINVLAGLEIYDNDDEIKKYLKDITPQDYRLLGDWRIHGYSNLISRWEQLRFLGEAYNTNKKIVRITGAYRNITDGEFQKLELEPSS